MSGKQRIIDDLAARLEHLLPPQRPVGLHEPSMTEEEKRLVGDCLDSGWVSSVGAYVDRFERELAQYTGAKHAVCVVNGTAALHVSLQLAGVRRGDEVLVPSLTFVATCNAIAYLGASPHFVDIEAETLAVDGDRMAAYLDEIGEMRDGELINQRSGRPIRALVVVHVLGHPARMDHLKVVADRFGLELIEDAAESLGSRYRDRHTGTWGRVGALSFNGNKIITTGGGGAVLTDNEQLTQEAKHLTTTAKLPHAWEFMHDQLAYNYRMPNINAALGCAQLSRLDGFIAAKRRLHEDYRRAVEGCEGVKLFTEMAACRSNHWLNMVILDRAELRDPLLALLHERGILARPLWNPMHTLPMFSQAPRMPLPVTESLVARSVCLPSSPSLASGDGQ